MEPQNPNIADQAKALWAKMSPKKRLAAVAGAALPLILVAYLALSGPGGDWEVLYSGLSAEDAGELVTDLRGRGIPYRISGNGTVIEVPASKVHETRIATAAAGLPRGGAGVGFEIFDEQSFGTSSFVEQVNYRRALQGELSRSVASLAAVEGARVHVAVGKRTVFRDTDEPPSASVALALRPGRKLTDDQVRGIVNLVASSVAGLNSERVVVIDDRGNVLSKDDDDVQAGIQTDLESTLSSRIRNMLERVVGPGRAAVTVTAKMDYRRVEATEELYDQKEPAIRSETRTVEGTAAPIAATTNSSPPAAAADGTAAPAPAPAPAAANADGQRFSESRKYEVNRVVRKTVEPKARIERLHVAILVDNDRDEEGNPVARSPESIAELTAIAREAAGIDNSRGDRIEVRSVPFVATEGGTAAAVTDANASPLPVPLPVAVAGGIGLLVIIAGVFFFIRGRRRRKNQPEVIQLPAQVSDIEAVLAGDDEDPLGLAAPTLHSRVLESVKADPARAARVVSAWLSEAESQRGKKAA